MIAVKRVAMVWALGALAALSGCSSGSDSPPAAAAAPLASSPPPVPTATIAALSPTVVVGASTTLTWSSTGATGCTASGAWDGAKAANGAQAVTPAAAGAVDYTLTCTGAGGSVARTATLDAIVKVDFLLTANENGNVSAYKLDGSTGAPMEVGGSPFPAGGRPRSIALTVDNRFAYAANSDTNELSAYKVDQVTGALTAVAGSPFATPSSPLGIAVHPSLPLIYVTISDHGVLTYGVNPTSGALTNVGTPVPGNRAIAIHPSGKFAYVLNTVGAPGLFIYAIDGNGALTSIGNSLFAAGSGPAGLTVDPAGKFLYVADQGRSKILAYSINATTGLLTQVAGSPFATATGPRAITIDPQSAFLYVACVGDPSSFGALAGYSINSGTGALTQVPGSPFHTHFSFTVAVERSGKFVYEVGGRGSAFIIADLRSFAIGSTGSLTEISGSPVLLGTGQALGIAATR